MSVCVCVFRCVRVRLYRVVYQKAGLEYSGTGRSYLSAWGGDALQQVHETIDTYIEIRSVQAQFHSSSKQFRADALTIGTQTKTHKLSS